MSHIPKRGTSQALIWAACDRLEKLKAEVTAKAVGEMLPSEKASQISTEVSLWRKLGQEEG